ncbi:MAG: CerR family C-terminal domain-containing protein [Gammaproteobacteria bacterium]
MILKRHRTSKRHFVPETTDVRGVETRRCLLSAGLRLFGRHGHEGVSTRALAREAGVNLAAIPYHFGSKDGTYLAVARQIVSMIGAEFLQATEEINSRFGQVKSNKPELVELLIALMTSMIRSVCLSPDRVSIGLFIMREQIQPTEAFDILYTGFMAPVSATYSQLVGALRDLHPDDSRVGIEVQMVLGQVFIFCTGRHALLRRLRWKELDEEHLQEIVHVLGGVVRRQFA